MLEQHLLNKGIAKYFFFITEVWKSMDYPSGCSQYPFRNLTFRKLHVDQPRTISHSTLPGAVGGLFGVSGQLPWRKMAAWFTPWLWRERDSMSLTGPSQEPHAQPLITVRKLCAPKATASQAIGFAQWICNCMKLTGIYPTMVIKSFQPHSSYTIERWSREISSKLQ